MNEKEIAARENLIKTCGSRDHKFLHGLGLGWQACAAYRDAQKHESRDRVNYEWRDGELYVCLGLHEKHEACDYVHFVRDAQKQSGPDLWIIDGRVYSNFKDAETNSIKNIYSTMYPVHVREVAAFGQNETVKNKFNTAPPEHISIDPIDFFNTHYEDKPKQSGPEFPEAEHREWLENYPSIPDFFANARWAWAKCCEMHVNLIKSADEYLESLEAENKRLREELGR